MLLLWPKYETQGKQLNPPSNFNRQLRNILVRCPCLSVKVLRVVAVA